MGVGSDAYRAGQQPPPVPPPALLALCPPTHTLSGVAGHGAGRCRLVPWGQLCCGHGNGSEQRGQMGSGTGGQALGTRGRSSLGPSSSSPLSRAQHCGGGSGHPLVPASTWALPAHGCARVCVHGCTQACGCAAERARARERVCARASVRARRWGGCVALPVRDRGWRARCGQGEGMHRPTDHLVQRLPEPAGRWRAVRGGGAGTAVEGCRQLVCCLQPPAAPGRLGGCRSSPATGEQPPASSAAPGKDPPWECAGQTRAAAGACSALPPACCASSASPGAVPQFPHLCCAC